MIKIFFKNRNRAFSLIEVMMAIGFFGAGIGGITYLFIETVNMRKQSEDYTRSVFLATQVMNEIKTKRSTESRKGKFEAFKGYQYKYEISEESINLANQDGELSEDIKKSPAAEYLEERNLTAETITGAVFKMLKYEVIVTFPGKRSINLKYYRGMGIQ